MEIPFLAVVLMLFLAICMFYGQVIYKKRGVEIGKTITIFCGFTIIAIALYINLVGPGVDKRGILREKKFQHAQLTILTKALSKTYSGSGKCLVIIESHHNGNEEYLQELTEKIITGSGEKISEVRFVSLHDDEKGDDMEMPMEVYEKKAEDFNKIFKENNDCDFIILFAPLPYETKELYKISHFTLIEEDGEWVKDPNYKYPIIGLFNGSIYGISPIIEEKLISAVTMWKNKPNMKDIDVPEDTQEAFNMRYLLITPENILTMKATYPQMFPKD
jgi:hypothetical protein